METAIGAVAAVVMLGLFVWLLDRRGAREHAERMAGKQSGGYLEYCRPTSKARWLSGPQV